MKIYGGLTWPIDGNPAFFCLIEETQQKPEESMSPLLDKIEITKEFESNSLPELLEEIKKLKRLTAIYTQNDPKYISFIKEFNRWRRESSYSLQLRLSQASSFEAGILQIKNLIKNDKLVFLEDSIIKSQLKIISKQSLKNEKDFYAVSALINAVSALNKKTIHEEEKIPNIRGFY